MPASTSFSMWSVYLLANVVVLALRARGVDVGLDHVARVDVGAYAGIAAMILWLGRRYYLAVLIACARPSRDPAVRAAVPWLWAAIAGMAAIVAWLAPHGAPAGLAIVVVLALFGFLLVCARILAEAGVAYLMFPANINSLTAVLGFGLPAASLMPLAMIGMCVVLAREALMPYAATASQLADRCRVGSGRLAPLMAVTAVVGAGVALAAKLWFSYRYFGHCDGWHTYAHEMDAVAAATGADRDAAARAVGSPASAATCYALGAALVAACGAGRLLIASWPLHPLALAVSLTWAGGHLWPSFLVAWLAKACVMRYGGVGVYRSLVPAAIGLIVGESLAIAAYGAIKLVAVVGFGRELPAYIDALPG